MEDEEGTHFLNVDLEIFSRARLDPIVDAFGEKVSVLHVADSREFNVGIEAAARLRMFEHSSSRLTLATGC
jgi:hypothetical protein